MPREIDPETNPFWQMGYDDAVRRAKFYFPDECRFFENMSDYAAGYDTGQEAYKLLTSCRRDATWPNGDTDE
jgi:hypothetical protein